ncbi:MAG: hypothetical protein IJT96_01660 [Lachnospiraceae bacterium]|nr:hypothetical protein [Lachnospiraceae bacterium]
MVFYLKVNRDTGYSLSNLRAWLDAASCMEGSTVYIVCDNESLWKKTEGILEEYQGMEVSLIGSDRETPALKEIAERVIVPEWRNCAYSHLTTFFHSKENGYKEFWNIDADDTFFCVSKERLAEILNETKDYAMKHGMGCFSLDMWSSRNHGAAWSFGVTYTDNSKPWIEAMTGHSSDRDLPSFFPGHTRNLDWYFTYLRDTYEELGIGSFYVENLRFVHYADDMYRKPLGSGFFHWKDGMLRYPLLFFFYGSKAFSKYVIPEEIARIDIGITDRESYSLIGEYESLYDGSAEPFFKDRAYFDNAGDTRNVGLLFNRNARFILFGAGQEGRNIMEFLGADKVKCFVDNGRHGTTVKGKPVLSFEELKGMDFREFILLVTVIRGFESITRQLEENGICNYLMLPYIEDYI